MKDLTDELYENCIGLLKYAKKLEKIINTLKAEKENKKFTDNTNPALVKNLKE